MECCLGAVLSTRNIVVKDNIARECHLVVPHLRRGITPSILVQMRQVGSPSASTERVVANEVVF